MSDKPEIRYVILHETVLQSWLKDVGSLGSLAMLIYVNHQLGAASAWVDGAGALLLLGWLLASGKSMMTSAHSYTVDEIRAALKEKPQ